MGDAARAWHQGLDLELLDPSDEGELTFLIEAQHTEFEDLRSDEEMTAGGEPFSPRLHAATATERASLGSFLLMSPVASGRTRSPGPAAPRPP